jgi:predicted choloylglycine hydrolase
MEELFRAVDEPKAGEKWKQLFDSNWPSYRRWFLSEGTLARPSYLASRKALAEVMPELIPTYDRLAELAGGGDLAARFLSLYCPAPYLGGCSQLALDAADGPVLIRNYDYSALLCEATWLRTNWLQPVIAMSDCAWGALDGVNASGLAISLAFGGRTVVGPGFGIPLLLRYVLETAANIKDAEAIVRRVPIHMTYNVTAIDARGDYFTAFLAPDRAAEITRDRAATNHQRAVEWPEHAALTATVERRAILEGITSGSPGDSVSARFLSPPIALHSWDRGWGTLYTAVYRPASTSGELRWRTASWSASFDEFPEREQLITYP